MSALMSALVSVVACTSHVDTAPRKVDSKKEEPASKRPVADSARSEDAAKVDPRAKELADAQERSDISGDEEVRLFPTFVARIKTGEYTGRMEGWIYEPEEEDTLRETLIAGLERTLGGGEELRAGLAVKRMRPFIYDNERGEHVEVLLGQEIVPASVSTKAGRFYLPLILILADSAEKWEIAAKPINKKGDGRDFSAPVYVLPTTGRIIISDIDDTIKDSNVRDKKALLRSTFLEPFRPVPGMAAVYKAWLEGSPGAGHLHFVSASPWQLFGPISEMVEGESFPDATYTLRTFRVDLMESMEILTATDIYKRRGINAVLGPLPQWKAVLVGDSGELDPEIYGDIARSRPEQVEKIFIRDVTGQSRDDERYTKAFADLPADCCVIFTEAKELPSSW